MTEPHPLISWLTRNGGSFHPDATIETTPYGSRVVALSEIPSGSTVVSCPFSLAITSDVAREALKEVDTQDWNERQLISAYLILHQLDRRDTHKAYVDALPKPEQLRTPLHFTQEELEEFKGTNVYGATLDRKKEWNAEWQVVQKALGEQVTWERYLTAATHLSSRAFPSTVLSETPTLVHSSHTQPVLIPGVDALNHARAHPVTWHSADQILSLIQRGETPQGAELFNNYGPKPNAELVLGYGFSLENNPEDTIVLQFGGASKARHEIGRGPGGYEVLWADVVGSVSPEEEEEEETKEYEYELEAAQILAEMVQSRLDQLPDEKGGAGRMRMRPEVAQMLNDYVQGQRAILKDLLAFAVEKEREAVEQAREQGIELVFDQP